MLWIIFLGLATLVWAANDIFFKLLGNQMNYFLALFVAAVSQVIIVAPFLIYAISNGQLNHSARGYGISALIGLLLGSGTIFFFYAFKYGAPPHGGIAPGIDRLISILQNEPNIREVIAFPKTGDGRDFMMNAPSEVDKKQLEELHIKIAKKTKK